MDFFVKAPNNNAFSWNEQCPSCKHIWRLYDVEIIKQNLLITCPKCNYKYKLNINP